MTISGRSEIGLEDVPWTLAAHRFDVLRTSIDPKIVQIIRPFSDQRTSSGRPYDEQPTSRGRPQTNFLTIT